MVLIDTNLMVLLVVGIASRGYVARHKRLSGFTVDDFDNLQQLIGTFSDIVLVPHVMAEAWTLARQIEGPANQKVRAALRRLVELCREAPVPNIAAVTRNEFRSLGLTDAVLLQSCVILAETRPTLVTTDRKLADAASACGYSFIDFRDFMLQS